MATNYHVPVYLKNYDEEIGPRPPRKMRQLLFPARCTYIHQFAPFAAASENAFNQEMYNRGIEYIKSWEKEKQLMLYNLQGVGGRLQHQPDTHLWSMAFHLPDSTWSLPCARCEFLHKSMYNYETVGKRCVIWKKEYSPLNCGESLALSMTLRMMKEHRVY
jgi:hypothetical protein